MDSTLTPEMMDILRLVSAKDGVILRRERDGQAWLDVNGTELGRSNEAAFAPFQTALDTLVEQGLVEKIATSIFQLTLNGTRTSAELKISAMLA